jgi:hypothetical protein
MNQRVVRHGGDDDGGAVWTARLAQLLEARDAPLAAHLLAPPEGGDIDAVALGTYRWFVVLLTREFESAALVRLWDVLFGDGARFEALLVIALAMMLLVRDALLATDRAGCLAILTNYPASVSVDAILARARELTASRGTLRDALSSKMLEYVPKVNRLQATARDKFQTLSSAARRKFRRLSDAQKGGWTTGGGARGGAEPPADAADANADLALSLARADGDAARVTAPVYTPAAMRSSAPIALDGAATTPAVDGERSMMALDASGSETAPTARTWSRADDALPPSSAPTAGEASRAALDAAAAATVAFELPDVPTTLAQHDRPQARPPLRRNDRRSAQSAEAVPYVQRTFVGTARSGIAERQGRRPTMEDADCVVDDMLARCPTLRTVLGVTSASFYGVFDGHAGARAAAYVAEHLLPVLAKELEAAGTADAARENAIVRAFRACDASLLAVSVNEQWDDGSTGVLALQLDNQLYVANCGDAECVVGLCDVSSSTAVTEFTSQVR